MGKGHKKRPYSVFFPVVLIVEALLIADCMGGELISAGLHSKVAPSLLLFEICQVWSFAQMGVALSLLIFGGFFLRLLYPPLILGLITHFSLIFLLKDPDSAVFHFFWFLFDFMLLCRTVDHVEARRKTKREKAAKSMPPPAGPTPVPKVDIRKETPAKTLAPPLELGMLLDHARTESLTERRTAFLGLACACDPRCLAHLLNGLADEDAQVRAAARAGLARLVPEGPPFSPFATSGVRQQQLDDWLDWWRGTGRTIFNVCKRRSAY